MIASAAFWPTHRCLQSWGDQKTLSRVIQYVRFECLLYTLSPGRKLLNNNNPTSRVLLELHDYYFVSSSFCHPYPHVCRVGHLLHTSSREKEVTLKSSSGDLTCVQFLALPSIVLLLLHPSSGGGTSPSVQFPMSAALQRLLQPLYVLRLCTALQHRF